MLHSYFIVVGTSCVFRNTSRQKCLNHFPYLKFVQKCKTYQSRGVKIMSGDFLALVLARNHCSCSNCNTYKTSLSIFNLLQQHPCFKHDLHWTYIWPKFLAHHTLTIIARLFNLFTLRTYNLHLSFNFSTSYNNNNKV